MLQPFFKYKEQYKSWSQLNMNMTETCDIEHAIIQYCKTFEEFKGREIGIQSLSDGLVFSILLKSATNFKITYGMLMENCKKWTYKLNNLKKLLALIQEYFEENVKKRIKCKDIDLVEIAKNSNREEIYKFFEVVIGVLTEAPNKEDHINVIMSLDEKAQTSFVSIIQNLLQNRISYSIEGKEEKLISSIQQLQVENSLLKNEVQMLLSQNFQLSKDNDILRAKQIDYLQEIGKIRDQETSQHPVAHQQSKEKQQLRNMIQNLKQKLFATVRQSQMKIISLKDQVHLLEQKCAKLDQMEQKMSEYKRNYEQINQKYKQSKLWSKEKAKLLRFLEEKEQAIKKMTSRLEEVSEMNYSLQQKQIYTKMELERRDVRYKQLEKQVKKRYSTSNVNSLQNIGSTKSSQIKTKVSSLGQEISQITQQQLEQLKEQIQELKKKEKESQKENSRLKKKIDKFNEVEIGKKRLQKLVIDLHNSKRQQLEVLLYAIQDCYLENHRIKQILVRNNISQ